jgi:hypothetical protein
MSAENWSLRSRALRSIASERYHHRHYRMHVRRIAWQFIFFAIFTNAAFSGSRARPNFFIWLIPKYIVGMRPLHRSAFPERMRLDYPERLRFQRNTSTRRSWRNAFGMNTSGIRDVERKIKELNQL